jgi:hypothetical protein
MTVETITAGTPWKFKLHGAIVDRNDCVDRYWVVWPPTPFLGALPRGAPFTAWEDARQFIQTMAKQLEGVRIVDTGMKVAE